ncbi:hypothetical protein F5888DRAFT_874691 [Russula emetica]|nr:hypothetical protein F5888DRAFT_874691 [Russula emetica]
MPKIAPKLTSKPSPMTAPTTPTPVCTTSPSLPSPPLVMSEPAWLTGTALKAANEHTYATQRAKKAADRAKAKMPPRKVPSSSRRSFSSSSSSSSASGGPGSTLSSSPTRAAAMTGLWAEVWEARKMSTDDLDWPELSNWSPALAEYSPLRPTQDREVSLSALVRPVKPRGAKAKAKEGEFEFLPSVKNVIVLDDAESNAPDEPWEYISSVGGDDEARKIFSYAEIVSKST